MLTNWQEMYAWDCYQASLSDKEKYEISIRYRDLCNRKAPDEDFTAFHQHEDLQCELFAQTIDFEGRLAQQFERGWHHAVDKMRETLDN